MGACGRPYERPAATAGESPQGGSEGERRRRDKASWLIRTVYSLIHAAADEVDAGRLAADDAARVLEATLVPALSPPDGHGRDALAREAAQSG